MFNRPMKETGMVGRLAEKVVIVTGPARGLGREFARSAQSET